MALSKLSSLLEPQGTWREGRARSYKTHVLSPGVSRAEKALLHTHVPHHSQPPTHIQQEPLQLPTISTNYHTCWERDLINSPLGLEGEPGPRAGVPGLSPLPQVAFQVWGKGLQWGSGVDYMSGHLNTYWHLSGTFRCARVYADILGSIPTYMWPHTKNRS